MSKNSKIILGIFTFLPIVIYFVSFGFFFSLIGENIHPEPDAIISNISLFFYFIAFVLMLSIGLLIYYLIHIARNENFDSNERLVWILIMFFAGTLGAPIYWYLNIWKTPAVETIGVDEDEDLV